MTNEPVLLRTLLASVLVIAVTTGGCSSDDDNNPVGPGNGNGNGNGNGSGDLFTPGAGVVDIDGNEYPTVILGGQEWMAVNLRTSRLSDGTAIADGADSYGEANWPTWVHYAFSDEHDATHGKIYNGFAAAAPLICPAGWRVPTLVDLQALVAYLGGMDAAGGKMKQAGTDSWDEPNTGGSNASGLNALASGYRGGVDLPPDFGFQDMGRAVVWWSTTQGGGPGFPAEDYLFGISLAHNRASAVISGLYFKHSGYCIRCMRDTD